MGALSEPVKLHDVENAEAFCAAILDAALAANGGYLRPDQREEALDFLLLTVVELARGYEVRFVGSSFQLYAGKFLRLRVNDWYRRSLGDSRSGRRLQPVSIDQLAADEHLRGLPPQLTARSHDEEVLNRVALRS